MLETMLETNDICKHKQRVRRIISHILWCVITQFMTYEYIPTTYLAIRRINAQ